MAKHDNVSAYAAHHNITKRQAAEEIERFTSFIAYQLECHGTVKLSGFGTFGTKTAAARTIVSPMTPDPIEVPVKRRPYFKMSATLKARVEA